MKLGDIFYTKVKDGKVVCYQLYNILNREYIKTVKSKPEQKILYSFRRINPISMKSLGNCDDSLTLEESMKKYKPLTDAIRVLFTKENV